MIVTTENTEERLAEIIGWLKVIEEIEWFFLGNESFITTSIETVKYLLELVDKQQALIDRASSQEIDMECVSCGDLNQE